MRIGLATAAGGEGCGDARNGPQAPRPGRSHWRVLCPNREPSRFASWPNFRQSRSRPAAALFGPAPGRFGSGTTVRNSSNKKRVRGQIEAALPSLAYVPRRGVVFLPDILCLTFSIAPPTESLINAACCQTLSTASFNVLLTYLCILSRWYYPLCSFTYLRVYCFLYLWFN